MKKIFFIFIAIILLPVFAMEAKSQEIKGGLSIEFSESDMLPKSINVLQNIRVGWNLGNTFEAIPEETSWGNPRTSQKLIDFVKSLGFNAIRIPIAVNAHTDKNNNYTLGVVMKNVAIVFAPICPHLCEAMWQLLGGEGLCCQQKLPAVDAKHLEETTMQVSIAVNGKFKVCITLDKNLEQDAIVEEAKKQDKVANALAGKEIKKVIVVNSKTGKMVNFVVG